MHLIKRKKIDHIWRTTRWCHPNRVLPRKQVMPRCELHRRISRLLHALTEISSTR